ncbi:MAG: hypothetical protein MUC39_01325 [Candidatus Omnitrophica bacterium]|jgi:hypothetical protein|nr:hypothetical protein [Candidatus Omnitrophota bacterium]
MKKTFSFLLAAFTFCFLLLPCVVFAKDITILYTGQTHAMLYTCSCPVEKDGGVSRRSSLITTFRRANPDILLVDAGNFFAGGLLDEYTQNTQMDMQRTLINLKAMELMKYDALALGEDEFNFGADFLKENINKTKLILLSSNIKAKEAAPYLIKEVAGVKVGLFGLTNLRARQKAGVFDFEDLEQAARQAIEKLRSGNAEIIVALSNLGDAENLKLIQAVGGIDVIINGTQSKDEPYKKIGQVLIVNSYWQGRKLGVLTLQIKDKKIADFKVELMRLSDKIKDDPQVKAILPNCFSDINCKNNGLTGTCFNPGTMSSSCKFEQLKKIKLTAITTKDCIGCDEARVENFLKKFLPGVTLTHLYYPDARAKKLIKDLKVSGLPVYFFGKEIESEKGFADLKQYLEKKNDLYVLKPELGGVAYFPERENKKGRLDLFISLYSENADKIIEELKEINPELHFLVTEQQSKFDAMRGSAEIEECLRSVCVKKYYPQAYWNYLSCRAKNINSSWWDNCLGDLDPYKIKTCATGKEGEDLLRENIQLNKELQIIFGPTYLLDNQEIFATQGLPKKGDLKAILKNKKEEVSR